MSFGGLGRQVGAGTALPRPGWSGGPGWSGAPGRAGATGVLEQKSFLALTTARSPGGKLLNRCIEGALRVYKVRLD